MRNEVVLGTESLINAKLIIVAGTSFHVTFLYKVGEDAEHAEPVDMTGWVAWFDFFKGGVKALNADACVSCGSDGTVIIRMPPAVTSQLEAGIYDYDLILVQPNEDSDALRFAAGKAKIVPKLSEEG